MKADNPGMHVTDTIDYGIVLSGAVALELDDGVKVELAPGDCVVQNGTMHAWRVLGDESCVMAFIMIGATRVMTPESDGLGAGPRSLPLILARELGVEPRDADVPARRAGHARLLQRGGGGDARQDLRGSRPGDRERLRRDAAT